MKTFKKFIGKLAEKPVKMFIGKISKHDPSEKKNNKKTIKEGRLRRLSKHSDARVEKLHQEFSKRHDFSKHTIDENLAIESYTGGEYEDMNHGAWSGEGHSHNKHLDSAISKHRTHRNVTVYSGMTSPKQRHTDGPHFTVHNPAFTSTSLCSSKATDFSKTSKEDEHKYFKEVDHPTIKHHEKYDSTKKHHVENKQLFRPYRHIAQIHVPKGSRGVYVEGHTENAGEHEMILGRNSKIKFKSKPIVDHDRNKVIWSGKLTHDGTEPTRHAEPDRQLDLFKGNK